jgi:hypothetical protein
MCSTKTRRNSVAKFDNTSCGGLLQLDLGSANLADAVVNIPGPSGRPRPIKKKKKQQPPAELLLVPERITLAELKRVVTEAFAELYRLCQGWSCSALLGLPSPGEGSERGRLLSGLPDQTLVVVQGEGFDPDPR